jgi:hypothetical protein
MRAIKLADAHAMAARNIGRDVRDVKLIQARALQRNVVVTITEDVQRGGGPLPAITTVRLTVFNGQALIAQLILDAKRGKS